MSKITKSFRSDQYTVNFTVENAHHDLRLDKFMQLHLGTLSREFIKRKIDKKEICIDGREQFHKASTKVRFGDRVTMLTRPRAEEGPDCWADGLPVEMEMEPTIIYEDEKILIISKPPFMSTHPSGRHLFHCATVFYESRYQSPMHSIHRLDRETSGVLILGKSPRAAQEISALFENGHVRKCYFLMAHKRATHPSHLYQFPFQAKERLAVPDKLETVAVKRGKGTAGVKTRIQMKTYPEDSSLGKSALTEFDLLYETEEYFLLLAFPKTGRQHQIRVHASHHFLPLVGDKLYNGDPTVFMRFKDRFPTQQDFELMQLPRHALHALAINFPYGEGEGENKERKTFITNIPADLRSWILNTLSIEESHLQELERKMQGKVADYFNRS